MWNRDNQSRFLFTSGSCFTTNRNVPIWIMLSCSDGSLMHRFPLAPARSSRRQEGVLLQGHPRPWPVAKPRTLWVPAHKVQFRICVVLVRGLYPAGGRSMLREYPATSTHSRFGQRGPGRAVPSLSSLPCWVVPPPKTRQSAEPPASSLASPLRGTASPCLSIPARYSSTPPPW